MKAKRTYILIADGARARLLLSEGLAKPLQQVPDADFRQELPPDRELHSDKAYRVQESATAARHAIERPDLHRREKQRFAQWLAEMLEAKRAAKDFDRLAIIAPPDTLADLRAALSEELRQLVIGEIAKDLTKVPNHEVRAHLENELLL